MSRGNRGNEPATLGIFGAISALVLCCFIVGILAFSSGQETERRDKTPAAYAEAAKSKAQHDCAGSEGNAAFECIYEKIEASQQQAHDKQDLTAQQKSANGTMITAALAFAGLIISVVGIGLVYTTFNETRKANEIFEGDQRPWVDVTIVKISMSSSKETFDISTDIVLKNIGRTPAFNVWSRARIISGQGQQSEKFGEFFPDDNAVKITNNLLPGTEGYRYLYPKMREEDLGWISVYSQQQLVAGPYFFPLIELRIEYEWGDKSKPGVTVKNFAISAVPTDTVRQDRVAYPITLGEIPVTQLAVFEIGVADVS